jgi:uncharacterized sulfatase
VFTVKKLRRREFIKSALAAYGGSTLPGWTGMAREGRSRERRPNLLFVFPDEMRRQAVGCMAADPVITPNLDRLAQEGMVLTNAVSNFPLCSPYRGMLLTGKYPFSNRVIHNCLSADFAKTSYLRIEDRCLSDVLHDDGYSLGYIGKWHLERPQEPYVEPPREGDGYVWDEFTPPERRHGFDFWYAYNVYDGHLTPHYWATDAKREEKTEIREWSARHEADIAIEYIANRGGKYRDALQPFALFVAHNPPHMPFEVVPEQYVEMYGNKTYKDLLIRPNVDLSIDEGPTAMATRSVKQYFAAITGVDENLGRMLNCLKDEGLEENTIVVFTSDHGEMMGSHNLMYKTQYYEESLGIPFIIRWPGNIKPGRNDILFGVPDVMPTLLGLMGLGDMAPGAVEGIDQSGVFLGRPSARPTSVLYMHIDPEVPARIGRRGLRTPRYTFVLERSEDAHRTILYDNEIDPYQLKNVAEKNKLLVQELTKELYDRLDTLRDPWVRV